MTGGIAICSKEVGGSYTAWDGYIRGTNIALKENEEIIQSWRTSEFDENDADSELIIRLKEVDEGCLFNLTHRNIREGQHQYEQGWKDHYLEPMKHFFQNIAGNEV